MSIGNSGRIVIEVEPEIKRQLYSALAREGKTLKEWFLLHADQYLQSRPFASSAQRPDGWDASGSTPNLQAATNKHDRK